MKQITLSGKDFDEAAFKANVYTLSVIIAKAMKDRGITEREGRLMAAAVGRTVTAIKIWLFEKRNPLPDIEDICAAEGWKNE